MRLLYNSSAVAYHEQLISFGDACRRYRQSRRCRNFEAKGRGPSVSGVNPKAFSEKAAIQKVPESPSLTM